MADKTDALKERYEKLGKRDLEGALVMCTDHLVWGGSANPPTSGMASEGSSGPAIPTARRADGRQSSIGPPGLAVGTSVTISCRARESIGQAATVLVLGHTVPAKRDKAARVRVVHF